MRDNVDIDDEPQIKVAFKVGIDCLRGVNLDDGTQVRVDLVRGKQKARVDAATLKQGIATFKQKIQMSTLLERKTGMTRYGRKELLLKLVRVEDSMMLGSAEIDLAEYHICRERTRFQVKIIPVPEVDVMIFDLPCFDV